MAATLRSIHGVKRCTKSRTVCGFTPTGTTISTRPPTCTRAVSRRARGLTRTANGSLALRVSNSDNCVPCASSRRMIPGSRGPPSSDSVPHQLRQLPLRRLVVGRGDQGFFDPVARAHLIAARLQLHAQAPSTPRRAPSRARRCSWPRTGRTIARRARAREGAALLVGARLGARQALHARQKYCTRIMRRQLERGFEPLIRP